MSTAREPIISYLVTALSAVSVAGMALRVFRSRDAAISRAELPALVVQPEEESVQFLSANVAQRKLTILLTFLVRAEPPDLAADPYLQAIHAVVMADPTLGGTVGRTVEIGTKWTDETGDVTGLAAEVRYEVTYATAAGNLAARY